MSSVGRDFSDSREKAGQGQDVSEEITGNSEVKLCIWLGQEVMVENKNTNYA